MTGYFVTGTDTGVGKTQVSSALLTAMAVGGERVIGMKPVASGCRMVDGELRNGDADSLVAASNVDADYSMISPYRFQPPIAPHIAAAEASVQIDSDVIVDCFRQLAVRADRVVVEGVGGWAVPLGPDITMVDVAVRLGLPVILVVGARLGCINHALLSRQAIVASGLALRGWVYNHVDPGMQRSIEVLQSLRERIPEPLLGAIPFQDVPENEKISRFLDFDQ